MDQLDLRLEGSTALEFQRLMTEAGMDPAAYDVFESRGSTGNPYLDIIITLSHTDLNALTLVIGYLIGKGLPLSALGGRLRIDGLKQAREQIVQLSSDDKKQA
jgi:hypothetical protein